MTVLVEKWETMDGYAVAHSMPDLREVDFGRLCNFVYWRLVDGADPEQVDKFRARLWQPPKGVVADKRSPWSVENEMSSFNAARAALGLAPSGSVKSDTVD